jgi:hypothetical protein
MTDDTIICDNMDRTGATQSRLRVSGNRYLYPGTGVTFRFDGEGGLALGKSVNVCLGAHGIATSTRVLESHSALTGRGVWLSANQSMCVWAPYSRCYSRFLPTPCSRDRLAGAR